MRTNRANVSNQHNDFLEKIDFIMFLIGLQKRLTSSPYYID